MIVTNYAIKFRNAVVVFLVVIAVAGTASYLMLPRELAPDITIPFVFVSAPYEGTSPQEIENLITIPIERQLNDMENLKRVSSVSSEGVCSFAIEFLPAEDIDAAKQKVKDKIDLARPDLPQDLDEPIVDAVNFSTEWPILMMAISGDTDVERLKDLAEDLQDEIELLPGVREAELFGGREREIRVELDLPRLIRYGVPLGAVMAAVARENATVTAGNIEMTGGKFQVRVPGEFARVADMQSIVVDVRDGQAVHLTDIAAVTDTFKDLSSLSRLNGQPCVSLHVKKRSGENTVALIAEVKRVLGRFRLPPGIHLTLTQDQSEDIDSMIKELENNIFAGFVLVIGVVLIFMGFRSSLFVSLAIPVSLLLSFVVLQLMGQRLNMLVLFSLVMALGMLVDNAIVITENIYRHRTLGESRLQAALAGASEVAWPVTTSTLTTVVAFWPLLYWPSIIGQFMSYLPVTLVITLLASLFVGLVVNPALCSMYMPRPTASVRHDASGEIVSDHPFMQAYERLLRLALRHRLKLTAGFALLLVVSFQCYGRFGRGLELFPQTPPRRATIGVTYPQGTHIEKTDATVRACEEKLAKYSDIEYFLSNVGYAPLHGWGGLSGTHVASIAVEFLPADRRKGDTTRLVEAIRADIGAVPGAEVVVDKEREGPPPEPPISVEVAGEDFEVLSDLAARIKQAIAVVPGLVDLKDDFEDALPELQFHVDRERAALLGLDTAAVGRFLRATIYGAESSKFRAGEDEYDITVRLPVGERRSADLFDRVFIPAPGGVSVPLTSLGEAVYTSGHGEIRRKDQKRVITLTGDIQQRSIDAVLRDVRAIVDRIPLPSGYGVSYAGENRDMQESAQFLSRAFLMAVGLIAVILVLQFNSVMIPLIIMVSIVFSMIGVVWGLLLCGMRFGVIMTGLGVISLAGVVVNNSIVLMDCALQQRRRGLSVNESMVAAGRLRLRPVLLTAGTTVLGLIPMAVGWSLEIHTFPWRFTAGAESSAWWAPMCVAVIFGLSLATVLTLVQVPVMFSLVSSLQWRWHRRFGLRDEGDSSVAG